MKILIQLSAVLLILLQSGAYGAPVSVAEILDLTEGAASDDKGKGPIACSLSLAPVHRPTEAEGDAAINWFDYKSTTSTITIQTGSCRITDSVVKQCKAALGTAIAATDSEVIRQVKSTADQRAEGFCDRKHTPSRERKCDPATKPYCEHGDVQLTACLRGTADYYSPANGAQRLCEDVPCKATGAYSLDTPDPFINVAVVRAERTPNGMITACTFSCSISQDADNRPFEFQLSSKAEGKKCYHCQHTCITDQ